MFSCLTKYKLGISDKIQDKISADIWRMSENVSAESP